MRWLLGFVGSLAATTMIVVPGCGGEEDGGGISCGPGTMQVGDTCVPTGGGSTSGGDASVGDPGGGSTGGGGGGGGGGTTSPDAGFGTEPPGGGGGGSFGGSPGCDVASGECDSWEAGILDGLRARQAGSGCADALVEDERVDVVAERHAMHQATIDRLDSTSPDGDLFDQVAAEGVRFSDAAAMFSVTRTGAEDVLGRWDANPSVAPLMTRCGYMTGVGVTTSESGASYVSVLMVKL